ncbi:hypothetical protein PAXRUDRAFT_37059 [Paxillus rubicundulus Ve08.2h10]|uniref:DUF6830 domain-containing protein n=1 Tax=Paxillus rubicundulus Ve08.2h10 TaxID=930991 RepID=A0A0D0CSN0_9AGAM|nr:hypothetical protein PAXRUDRAFT_37059 [Paxillus rubicundulus Ve08.2h10]
MPSAAALYELPDLRLAIADYLKHHHMNFNHTVGGQCQAFPNCELPFSHIQICLYASPLSAAWAIGCYNSIIITTDGNQDWPHSGLQAQWSNGDHIGNVVPSFQICAPVHLIPCFGQKLHPNLNVHLSNELSSSFWLNKYWTKELFHALSP